MFFSHDIQRTIQLLFVMLLSASIMSMEHDTVNPGSDCIYNRYNETIRTYFPNESEHGRTILDLIRSQKLIDAKEYIQNFKNDLSCFALRSAIELAASYNYADFVSFCIKNNVIDGALSRALVGAAYGGKLALLQSLEAEYLVSPKKLIRCFCPAADLGHIGILDYIVQKTGTSCLKQNTCFAPQVAFVCAAKNGNVEIVRFVLGLGIIDVNDPFVTAINNGHAEIVEELIKNGADVNGTYYHIKPSSLLGYTLQKNNLSVIKTVLKHGARIQKNEWKTMQTTHPYVNRNIKRIISLYFPYFNDSFVSVEMTYYAILGIASNASASMIKQSYYGLAKLYHPDRNGGTILATEIFKVINNAYECLSNPMKKRLYDSGYDCCYSSFKKCVLLPVCQICRKDCFTVKLNSYPHPCCGNSAVLCAFCEKQHAQVSKNYLHCCDR